MTPEDFRRETTDDKEVSNLGEKGGFSDEPTSSWPGAKSSVDGMSEWDSKDFESCRA
jgi:hypothetical protein